METKNTWQVLSNVGNKIMIPWLRWISFACLLLTIILSLLIRMPVYESTVNLQRWIAIRSVYLLFGGLPLIALGFGFFSLLFLKKVRERIAIILLMSCIAWLTQGYQFFL